MITDKQKCFDKATCSSSRDVEIQGVKSIYNNTNRKRKRWGYVSQYDKKRKKRRAFVNVNEYILVILRIVNDPQL